MKNLLKEICVEFGYNTPTNKVGITLDMLLDAAISGNIIDYVREATSCSRQTVTNALKRAFPDRDPIHDRSIVLFLLLKKDLKKCSSCNAIKQTSEFYYNSSKTSGLADFCKECNKEARRASYAKNPQKELAANRIRDNRKNIKQTPKWADLEKIETFYRNRPKGFHVDHILPLNGALVSGLHVESNLQYLSEQDNLAKSNFFDIEKYNSNLLWYKTGLVSTSTTRLVKADTTDVRLNLSKEYIQKLVWDKPFSIGCKDVQLTDNGLKKMAIRLNCIMPPPRYHTRSLADKIKIRQEVLMSH